MADAKWPPDMVDARRLFELLGHKVGDRRLIGEDAYARLENLERAVERARDVGRIKRFVARDPATGDVVAYGYKREDIKRIIENRG